MSLLLHELITRSAERSPDALAMGHRKEEWRYAELSSALTQTAGAFAAAGLAKRERVGIYLPKCFEMVIATFATAAANGVFVPVNPVLKPAQVGYILRDCNARILVTSLDRVHLLEDILGECTDLHTLIVTGSGDKALPELKNITVIRWEDFLQQSAPLASRTIDTDMAAILYTSGSTGNPKGVVLSHRNMVAGADSVSTYLENTPNDRILAVLPFSFDAGFSQMTTAFTVGASCFLMDYLLPRDVIRAVARYQISGLGGVPPLWVQLAQLEWPQEAVDSLRYFTNTGGAMPTATLADLRASLPNSKPYLMYGLTEAFRSTYLPPSEVDNRPGSMGKAIPNAEIMVVREDGTPCEPNEPGELVHRGALVSLGYWNDPARTAERFKPAPNQPSGIPIPELAVWSGDTVRADEDGFLYFIGRKDDMIKTSGYRVSPSEIEEVIHKTEQAVDIAALGIPHPALGQAIVIVLTRRDANSYSEETILSYCREQLPAFMVPHKIVVEEALPRNPNGTIDRNQLVAKFNDLFEENAA